MATTFQTIVTRARQTLLETSANFWSDDELFQHALDGAKEMWKGVIDLYKDHIVTLDDSHVSVVANTTALTGVPTDLFRVLMLRPRTLGADNRGLIFKPRQLTDPDFVQAEAMPPVAALENVIYYAVINAGAPVAAPAIHIAPIIGSDVPLTLKYNPTLPSSLTIDSNNPIPGESDKALIAYTIAWARAKERPARDPDPEYISIYATEKTNTLVALTPRSVQEPEYAEGMWEPPAPGSVASDWSPY